MWLFLVLICLGGIDSKGKVAEFVFIFVIHLTVLVTILVISLRLFGCGFVIVMCTIL